MSIKESPFACDLTAIPAAQREAHLQSIATLFRIVESVDELPNGYSFRLPNQPDVLRTATEFIGRERSCCPFFGFVLEIESEGGPIWLSLTGREGVKPFIMEEIGDYLPAQISP